MKQRLVFLVFFLAFVSTCWYVYGDEYWGFHDDAQVYRNYKDETSKHKESFDINELESVDAELFVTPDRDFLDTLVSEIDAAQRKVWVEVYIFTEKDLRDALIRAYNRGVDVRVLLENNPYQAPYLNDSHFDSFVDNNIAVSWSDPLNYTLNHSKLLIIDDRAYVATGNFSYATFTKNRDFFVALDNPELVSSLGDLFQKDFSAIHGGVVHDNIVLSPEYSRSKILGLTQSAKDTIDFYFPYMDDELFDNILFMKAKEGISIRGIVSSNFYEENPDVITRFLDAGIVIHPLTRAKLHAKSVLVDSSKWYIGSINFSSYSFDENREIGIISSDKKVATELQNMFNTDF